ncbi:MAG: beta-propeller domain-containing protein [bacterium]
MTKILLKEIKTGIGLVIILGFGFIAGAGILSCSQDVREDTFAFFFSSHAVTPQSSPVIEEPKKEGQELEGIQKFKSEQEFKEYLEKGELASLYDGASLSRDGGGEVLNMAVTQESMKMAAPERISETNVQVAGIDEPDIVKTDGQEIYFSGNRSWIPRGIMMEEIMPPYFSGETKVVTAFPPADLEVATKIDKQGNLLLSGNTLIVFSSQMIYGYDVSDPKDAQKKWEISLKNNTYIKDVRLYDGKVYLVTATSNNYVRPCPIIPLAVNGSPLEIKCTDIYHPTLPVFTDITFIALVFDPLTGNTEQQVSFVGASDSSIVYMSQNAIYISYSYQTDISTFYFNFLKTEAVDLFPAELIARIGKVSDYDISSNSKITELTYILSSYINSLEGDERMRVQNEIENRISDYYKEHKRELEKTGIAKINLNPLTMAASGVVPGRLLNQFSLDEYEGNLRIAVTVGSRWWGVLGGMIEDSGNDVYVLDSGLEIIGTIKDLGLTERIYSARFVGNKGYLVTFRQTDPFYVMDLSDPQNPQLKGELKIPGYSAYLHPISDNMILGIGQENWQVKISLFNVSSPANPKEEAKYLLDESWSDILSTHHAFLLDSKHAIFFLPGSRGGYIFSYQDNKLELKKAISNISARRALYINDYLYLVGDDKIVVLDENTWQRVTELSF